MYNDVKLYINSCSACQTNKPSNQKPAGLLQPLPIPLRPFQTVGIDMVTGLPPDAQGNNTTVVFTCHTTRTVLLVLKTVRNCLVGTLSIGLSGLRPLLAPQE
jgi:hypothetical protein